MVNPPPTGTVTFLFTDVEGSTALHEDYPDRMQAALERHDDILRSSIHSYGGYVFARGGDAFSIAFSTAKEGVQAALAAQRTLFAEGWPENVEVRVRMGLHTGVADEREGDYFGPPVNRAARLMSAGHGGQVLLSDATYNLVRDHLRHLEPEAELQYLGEHRLKDLRYTERIFQLRVTDLPKEFEPLKTHGLVTPEEVINLDRRYRRVRYIGGGGFGSVYLVHHETLDRDMALKVLGRQYTEDEQFKERFKSEAKNAAKLNHPNIVQVYDAGEGHFEGQKASYITMEYVPGGTLEDLIAQQGGPLPPRTTTKLALEVARALEAAHRGGVIHRDIKPQNILLTESGEAKVADFGIARAAAASTRLTRTGFLMGTLHYMSPEQANDQPASPRSDLYSLGVVLYQMLTGKLPFDAETPAAIMVKHISEPLRPPKEVNPDVPERINGVCLRLLSKDPEDRHQDASALIEELEVLVRSPEEEQPPAGRPIFAGEEQSAIIVPPPPSTVRVLPDLGGKSVSQASSELAGKGLKLGSQSEAPSDTASRGRIFEQDPPAGTEVEADSSVSITVSSGPSLVEVPNLAGQKLPQARNTLSNAGLVLGRQRKASSDTRPEGQIVEQSPEAGKKVKPNSSVRVTLSSGPQRRASVRSGKRAKPWIWVGLLCAVVAIGLIAALAYSLTGEETRDFALASTLSGHSGPVGSVAFSPDGSLLASGSIDSTVKLWDPQSGEELRTLSGHSNGVTEVAFSPDESLLASVSGGPRNNDVKLWDPQSGEELRTLSGSGGVTSVAFSPDGSPLAIGSLGSTVKLRDPQSGEELQTLTGAGRVSSVAFSPDGRLLAGGGVDSLKLWDPQSGEELRTLIGEISGVITEEVTFSPDGSLLASVRSDRTVKLWDPQSGEELRTLGGRSDGIESVAFSPDGNLLASGSNSYGPSAKSATADNTAELWDPQSGEELRTLSGHSAAIESAAFSPDGSLLASGGSDGTVELWERAGDEW